VLECQPVRPLMRWAGGKRWLVPHIRAIAALWQPSSYVEPFVGGGAIFFAFEWPDATISDVNEELIAAYRGIALNPGVVAQRLRTLRVDPEVFKRVRSWRPRRDEWRAVRLLYLNRCSYGGIYRTDRYGNYNVPFSGDRSLDSLLQNDRLEVASAALRRAQIRSGDFESQLAGCPAGSFVFCDPAYSLPGSEVSFRRYSAPVFDWSDQCRLAEAAHSVCREGSLVVVTNVSDPRVDSLYGGSLSIQIKRRVPFPRAGGRFVVESLHVLGERALVRAIRVRLEEVL